MTPEEQRREAMRKFDSMGFVARTFQNEYGEQEYRTWRQTKTPLPAYERELRKRLNLTFTDELPVTQAVREYEKKYGNFS